MSPKTKRRPPWGIWEHCRLFLSYQRYAFLLMSLTATLLALAFYCLFASEGSLVWRLPTALIAGIGAIRVFLFTLMVAGRWPKKVRATAISLRRIEQGRFQAASVKPYCEDPCFRVVAYEILCKAGVSPRNRRDIVRKFRLQLSEPAFVVLVDAQSEEPVQVSGKLFTPPPHRE